MSVKAKKNQLAIAKIFMDRAIEIYGANKLGTERTIDPFLWLHSKAFATEFHVVTDLDSTAHVKVETVAHFYEKGVVFAYEIDGTHGMEGCLVWSLIEFSDFVPYPPKDTLESFYAFYAFFAEFEVAYKKGAEAAWNAGIRNCPCCDRHYRLGDGCPCSGDGSDIAYDGPEDEEEHPFMEDPTAASSELLTAFELLYNSFVHIPGNVKGNKAKTDVLKYNEDVRAALNEARQAIDNARRTP